MAKQPRVWSGTQWEPLAVTLPDLSNYSTTTQMNAANTSIRLASGTLSTNTVNLSNVLSDTYKFYNLKVIVSGPNSNFLIRARENTTDVATSYAQRSTTVNGSGTTSNYLSGTNTAIQATELYGSTNYAVVNVQLYRQDATMMHLSWAATETYNGNFYLSGVGVRTGMTAFNGISFYLNSGSMGGSYILTGTN